MDSELSYFLRLTTVLEAMPDALVIINKSGRIALINKQTEILFGYERTELLGELVEHLMPERFRMNHTHYRDGYFTAPRVRAMGAGLELFGMRKDGTEFPLEISLSPLKTEDGVFALAAIRDTSARKKIEDAKAMLSAIVAYSDDAIIGQDLDGNIFSWNDAAEQLCGYSYEEAVGQSIALIFPKHHAGELKQMLEKSKLGEVQKHISTERLHKSGKLLPVSITVSPIKNVKGLVIGASSTIRDISEQKRLEEELRSKNKELEQQNILIQEANRLKSEFLANMSHELRTPLNGIIGFTEMMIDDVINPVTEEQQDFLNDILTSSHHLLRLINDMLDLAKIEAGKMEFFYELVDLTKVIHEVKDILRMLMAGKRIRMEIKVDPTLGQAIIDPAKFKQILYNYISNAIKFSPESGLIQKNVTLDAEQRIRLEVVDQGIGIKRKDQDRLFIEFHQLDSSVAKKYQGTGLGLALTRRIVEAQGGTVGVISKINKGSTFYALLPNMKLLPSNSLDDLKTRE